MLKCKACGKEFEANLERHYVAKDNEHFGICLSGTEVNLYDAFDCPVCGCQVIVQERKRDFLQNLTYTTEIEEETEMEEEEARQ